MVTQQPFKPSYYRAICQLAIPENYDWRQFPRESPSKLSEKSRMPLQVALRHTERVLFGPFWRSYTGQIYGRNPAPTPFRTVSLGSSVNSVNEGNRKGRSATSWPSAGTDALLGWQEDSERGLDAQAHRVWTAPK